MNTEGIIRGSGALKGVTRGNKKKKKTGEFNVKEL